MEEGPFIAADFEALRAHVDYFSLMTYDFGHHANAASSSPLTWFEGSHVALSRSPEHLSQILGGINLYGNDFHLSRNAGGPIVGHEILKLLATKKPKITWNTEAMEHNFHYSQDGVDHIVWFPTLNYLHHRIHSATHNLNSGLSFWELGQGMDYFYDLL